MRLSRQLRSVLLVHCWLLSDQQRCVARRGTQNTSHVVPFLPGNRPPHYGVETYRITSTAHSSRSFVEQANNWRYLSRLQAKLQFDDWTCKSMKTARPHGQDGSEKCGMAGRKGAAKTSITRPVRKNCNHLVRSAIFKTWRISSLLLLLLSGHMISTTAWLVPAATWPTTRVTPPRAPFAESSVGTARSALVRARASSLVPQSSSRAFMFRNRLVARGAAGTTAEGQEQEMQEEPPLWLGLDLSTQSLTAAVLRGKGAGGASNNPVVLESINFEVCGYCCRVSNISPTIRIYFPPCFNLAVVTSY